MEITKDQLENIVDTVLKVYIKERKTEEKRERDRRLRNTKLLLRNYHTFKRYAEKHEGESEYEYTPIQELVLNSQDIVASIRMTTERTLVMIHHFDKALNALSYICEQEKEEDKSSSKHYDILKMRFIDLRAIEEIATEYNLNERTIYKQIDAAAERLSVLLFGVYGLRVE